MCDLTESINSFTTFTAGNWFQDVFTNEDTAIPLLAMGVGGTIAVCALVCTTFKAVMVSRAREATKRELAAYVAEGSLDPDKAVAMINAGRPHWEAGAAGASKGRCC